MDWVVDNWPFIPGQQELILAVVGWIGICGLIVLNVFSLSPLGKAWLGQRPTFDAIVRYVRFALYAFIWLGFLILVVDVQVNGLQIVDMDWMDQGAWFMPAK